MIPLSLSLRNFMSYGDEHAALDFTGLHLVALTGDNGNGKSALLDAITYALWGKTRASGSQVSSEDDLVRLGADEMEITFSFQIGEDVYRVNRKRNRRTRTGDWQVELRDTAGTWRSVSGTGMRETERQLRRILRMEYETFLNSAYIQQGHADEFTRQKPDARKRILADILDLTRYERLEEMARERRTDCDLLLKDLEGETRHYEARAAEEPVARERLVQQEAQLVHSTRERSQRETEWQRVRAQFATVEERAQKLRDLEERTREAAQEVHELEEEIARLQTRLADNAARIEEKPALLAATARLTEVRADILRLEPTVAELHRVQQATTAAQSRFEQETLRLRHALETAEAEEKRNEERQKRIAVLEKQIAEAAARIDALKTPAQERDSVQQEMEKAQAHFAALKAESNRLQQDVREVEEVLDVLAQPKTQCPTCLTDLSGGRQQVVIEKQEAKREKLRFRLAQVRRDGKTVQEHSSILKQRFASLEERLKGAVALEAQRKAWIQERNDLEERHRAAAEIAGRAQELRSRLAGEVYGAEERAELARLADETRRLTQAAEAFREAKERERAFLAQDIERRAAQITEIERTQEQDILTLREREARRDKRCEQMGRAQKQIAALRQELGDYETLRREVLETERVYRDAAAAYETAFSQIERTRNTLEECVRAAAFAADKRAERDRIAKDKQAYTELTAAFGKKGVQALIIDNALPEIQEETNRLLSRMTDSAMQVTLTTLRESRTTARQIETLDIQITDDAGTRPYEMYSGGEAFRINFALRIALSRLLARRAGARLQTLIIDEGFGTQDAKGRERLVEAIEAVKDEFALILVITHIEELKDAFPSRVEIIKTPAGSQINMLL